MQEKLHVMLNPFPGNDKFAVPGERVLCHVCEFFMYTFGGIAPHILPTAHKNAVACEKG